MLTQEITETLFAFGHINVRATHRATLEFTKDKDLSRKGNCILTTGCDKAVADLGQEFAHCLRKPNAKLAILIEVDGLKEEIRACGSPFLVLSNPIDIVIRKSDYVCSRTLAIRADKAAADLSRELVEKLKNPNQRAKITLTVRS